ncbi:MAG: aspartate--ammonia ligase [Erysipelotrichaceae bacterium]|nr:aspartate--ammonia ligase [Erysipelotrichaceae bacterium]
MENLTVPQDYYSLLSIYDTQNAIKLVKDTFEQQLAANLHLYRVTAPLFVSKNSGLNDNLNGVERPVCFDVRDFDEQFEIVHSLAKWKRMALKQYDFYIGKGLYTDMNAIRRDETLDNLHSVYVDQWDWEKVITRQERTIAYLQNTVRLIMHVLLETEIMLENKFPLLKPFINENIFFITTQELLNRYPHLNAKEREYQIVKEYRSVFLMQIGDYLSNGEKHDGRAPDYDDWQLNGDILIYNELLDCTFELSSMGIRVDAVSLREQLRKSKNEDRLNFPFHHQLLSDELPLTIGGGIGQSRLCMLLLRKAHIGEVQVSCWSDELKEQCAASGIFLL